VKNKFRCVLDSEKIVRENCDDDDEEENRERK
jgi:hypothetical protein